MHLRWHRKTNKSNLYHASSRLGRKEKQRYKLLLIGLSRKTTRRFWLRYQMVIYLFTSLKGKAWPTIHKI